MRSVDYEPDDDDDEGNAYENWTIAAELELGNALRGAANLCGAAPALSLALVRAGALRGAERLVRRHVDAHEAPQRKGAAAHALDLVLYLADAIGADDVAQARARPLPDMVGLVRVRVGADRHRRCPPRPARRGLERALRCRRGYPVLSWSGRAAAGLARARRRA